MSDSGFSMDPAFLEAAMQAFLKGDMMSLLNLLPIKREKQGEWFSMSFPLIPIFRNPLGILHGGITAYMLDTAMGWSLAQTTGKQVVTLQMNINYLSPGKGEFLRVLARPTHVGKSSAVAEVYMVNEQDRRIAQGTGTFFYTGNPAIQFQET